MSTECVVIDFPAQVDVALEEVARTLFREGLPAPRVELEWEYKDDDTIAAIAKAFPDAGWFYDIGDNTEWAEGRVGPISLTVIALLQEDRRPRLKSLMDGGLP